MAKHNPTPFFPCFEAVNDEKSQIDSMRSFDLTGMRFGKWTAIKRVCYPTSNASYWLCRCDCGREYRLQPSALKNGNAKQCRVCIRDERRAARVSVIGQTFGRWTVVDPGFIKDGVWRYLCRCVCGMTKNIALSSLKRGSTKGCKGCQWVAENPDARNSVWHRVVSAAKKRDIPVLVDKEYIFGLLESQKFRCALTGVEITISRRAKADSRGGSTVSLDRIDSRKPYEIGNCQWVHKDINRMKWNLEQDKFINLCKQVAQHNPGNDI